MRTSLTVWLADVLAAGGASAILAPGGVQTETPHGPALVTITLFSPDAPAAAGQAIQISLRGDTVIISDPLTGTLVAHKRAAPAMIRTLLRGKRIRRVLRQMQKAS